ncbi:hypothetical protein HYV82_04785 [Candidatus Woesearchaeota archaeon]|nr:hypothetical protein [Candidatus Woesearchaeota archaeon]
MGKSAAGVFGGLIGLIMRRTHKSGADPGVEVRIVAVPPSERLLYIERGLQGALDPKKADAQLIYVPFPIPVDGLVKALPALEICTKGFFGHRVAVLVPDYTNGISTGVWAETGNFQIGVVCPDLPVDASRLEQLAISAGYAGVRVNR